MGFLDLFRGAPDVETARLRLHFVRPAYAAAREVVEDARLHWWDRDDGTVDVAGDGSHALADRVLEAAKATVPAERARVDAEEAAGRLKPRHAEIARKRLDALEAEAFDPGLAKEH